MLPSLILLIFIWWGQQFGLTKAKAPPAKGDDDQWNSPIYIFHWTLWMFAINDKLLHSESSFPPSHMFAKQECICAWRNNQTVHMPSWVCPESHLMLPSAVLGRSLLSTAGRLFSMVGQCLCLISFVHASPVWRFYITRLLLNRHSCRLHKKSF